MPKPIARTPEAIRGALLADPNTAELAKTIGVSLDTYIEQVIFFAMNPGSEPQLGIMSEEEMKAQNLAPPPTDDQIGRYLIDALQVMQVAGSQNAYADAKPEVVDLRTIDKDAEPIETSDEKLKEELEKQLRTKRNNR